MAAISAVRLDGVGIITLRNAPVNSLSKDLLSAFEHELQKLVQDVKVKAILVTGAGKFFSGSAEISELTLLAAQCPSHAGPSPTEALRKVIDLLDSCPKTTVAAINGQALGGGLEVAMGCHYRVAAPQASLALPEVKLGLLPGGQGTQRLPLLAPLATVMQMLLQGKPLTAEQAHKNGIVDKVAEDVVGEAAALALARPPSPVSKRPVPHASRFYVASGALEQGLLAATRMAPGAVAPFSIISCLKAAYSKLSFEEGLRVEDEEFGKLLHSVQSAALRHLFFAERLTQKVPGLDGSQAQPLRRIGIVGAGLMGGGISMCFAEKGIPVVLKDAKQEWLDAGMKRVCALWESQMKRGRISHDKFRRLVGLVTPTLSYSDFSDVDIVIEAVPEIMDLKKQIFRDVEQVIPPHALICTNTSGLSIDEMASVLTNPGRVMGTHFFSPANVMQLLENARASHSSDRTVATGMAMGKLLGKKTVLVGNCDGFVGNRMLAPYSAEARMLWEEGADVDQIDAAAQDFGMAMGPMALGDLVGQEIFWKQRKAGGDMRKHTKNYMGPYEVTDWICEQGHYGQKTPDPKIKATGRGIFIHHGRKKEVDPEVDAKMQEVRKMKGVVPRPISNEEVIDRLFFPLINEGFKILEEGYAARASDIDIEYIFGYGFPPIKGGPMFYAENYVGLPKLLELLKVYAAQARNRFTQNPHYLPVDYFEPSPLLVECVAQHGTKVPPGQSLID
ncbi:unnamed protein product, partial [Polarella glacialis]